MKEDGLELLIVIEFMLYKKKNHLYFRLDFLKNSSIYCLRYSTSSKDGDLERIAGTRG